MPIIGATELQPVNILGSYVQGLEMGRANQLAQQQTAKAQRQEARAEEQYRLGMEDRETQRRRQELQEKRDGYALLGQIAGSAVDQSTYDQALATLQDLGVDISKVPPAFDAKVVKGFRDQTLTEAQRIDAELRTGTLEVQQKQAQTALEREQRLSRATATVPKVQPPKLKQGERWNPQAERVEAVPGSDIYVKQKKEHTKDFDTVKSTSLEANLGRGKIDALLNPNNKKEFENLFGGYTAYATGRMSGKTSDLRTELNSLKSNLKTAGKRIISAAGSGAIGQITEREWPILESMLGELVPEMSVDGARNKLEEIRRQLDKMEALSKESYETTWADSQYYKDIPIGGEPKGSPKSPVDALLDKYK